MDEEKRESFVCCPIKDINNLRTGLCERPLEAEVGHCDDGHDHDGHKGIHAHCPIHGAIYFNFSRTTINRRSSYLLDNSLLKDNIICFHKQYKHLKNKESHLIAVRNCALLS